MAKYEKEGFGQERISFCQITPSETANNNLNLMKLITSQSQEPDDTSSTEDSDEPHPKVLNFEFVLNAILIQYRHKLFNVLIS